MTIKVTY